MHLPLSAGTTRINFSLLRSFTAWLFIFGKVRLGHFSCFYRPNNFRADLSTQSPLRSADPEGVTKKDDVTVSRPGSVASTIWESILTGCETSLLLKQIVSWIFQKNIIIIISTENIDESLQWTIRIFIDLSKAFDTVDHNILLYKLEHYGFHCSELEFFLNYQKQYVSYNSCKSQLKDIVCSVPQGSILGPLLFILYVNDITSTSNVLDFILLADDTTILYSHENIESQISVVNAELKEVSNWFKTSKSSVNASKTNYMVLGTSHMTSVKAQQDFNVILDDTFLDRVKNFKFLGAFTRTSLGNVTLTAFQNVIEKYWYHE